MLRGLRHSARSLSLAVLSKAAVLRGWPAPVADNCQIPNLREKYRDLGLPHRGTFVEIGGFDGQSWSNTSFLADEGWRGVYVEPVPAFCRLIRLRHVLNNVSVEPVAVSEMTGMARMTLMDALTTCNGATVDAYRDITWAKPAAQKGISISVKTDTLANVLARNAVPRDLDLMVVDVEGHEEPIIESLLASPWRPKVLIIELTDLHPDFAKFPDLQASAKRVRQRTINSGYREVYADPINTVFNRTA
jgi:FkbM family methyltransferase